MSTKIREIRIAGDLSQRELSKLSGVSNAVISKLESGEGINPSYSTVQRLSLALKVSMSDIAKATKSVYSIGEQARGKQDVQ